MTPTLNSSTSQVGTPSRPEAAERCESEAEKQKALKLECLRAHACDKIAHKLLQRLYVFRNAFGVVSRNSADGFLVRSFLGIVALGEQIVDLIDA